jgi:uncharacterized heparinase superfamily protein
MPGLLTYWHTLRHLKPIQLYGRIWFRLARPRVDVRQAPPLRSTHRRAWVKPAARRVSLVGPERFCFLNDTHDLAAGGWDDPALEKLWRYNLHYFDDLNAQDADARAEWHQALLLRWVRDNPPAVGTGWEPYPTSLRIVNWIKWALDGHALPPECVESLAVQTRWLSQHLEIHLLGNHLFVNAKALVFAGVYFDGPEAEGWLENGLRILEREVREQVLPDGGHIERSPMYHALALEDMLDLINLAATSSETMLGRWRRFADSWLETVERMRVWLAAMCHPDGEISFFNDAAIGIAPSPMELEAYAGRLGLPSVPVAGDGVAHFHESGYIRVQRGNMVALLDVAPVGPDYLPGHAHADTLSFELSLFGRRVLVNSGTSRYGVGPERLRQRGTAAHNTVTIDGQDSSEVWGGFRVARRAKPFGLQIQEDANGVHVVCSHDGYERLPGRPIHRRDWRLSDHAVEIVDTVDGKFGEALGRLFFSPALMAPLSTSAEAGHGVAAEGRALNWRVEGAAAHVVAATYHPEFGVTEPNHCLEMGLTGPRSVVRFTWD